MKKTITGKVNPTGDNSIDGILTRRKFLKTAGIAAGTMATISSPLFANAFTENDPIAQTKYGKISGKKQSGVNIFKGVRYGADTSIRRFQPALPPEKWDGILQATEYGASAPQGNGENSSEDCLFLNVWTPGLNDGKKRPILFYIHGGAYSNGSGSSTMYDGTNICLRGDVVLITVNHRLNAFGYLYLGMLGGPEFASSGNVGQLDLIMALEWVKEHAKVFGGDPDNVTLFGQSGGGAKIASLMATPAAKGLFHRAWTMSGQQVTAAGPRAATQRAKRLLEALTLTPKELDKIKTIPIKQILDGIKVKDLSTVEDRSLYFCPVMDSIVLPRHPFFPNASPVSANVPMVIGNTRRETRAFLGNTPGVNTLTWEQLPELITVNQFVDIRAEVVIEQYRKMYPDFSPTEVFFASTTAGRSWRGAVIEAEERAKQAGAGTYVYQLDWGMASHALDIPLVFDNTRTNAAGNNEKEKEMAKIMSETILAFAKSGNPNNAAIPQWKPYSLKNRETMIFNVPTKMENDPRGGERELYSIVPFTERGTY
jgi:para-nitrobenzyl esterase